MSLDVCIVGAGIMSLSVAVNLQRLIRRVNVTVIADRFGSDTLNETSPGLFLPIPSFFKGYDKHLVANWLHDSWTHHWALVKSKDKASLGHKMLSGYYMWTDEANRVMKSCVFNYHKLSPYQKLEENLTYPHVCSFTTVQIDEQKYLQWLMKEFRMNGGKIINDTVDSLQQLHGQYDVVVNCIGRRARELVADPDIVSIKGHRVQVLSKWAKNFYITEENISAIPHPQHEDILNVGYLWTENAYSAEPDSELCELLLHKTKCQIHRLIGCKVVNLLASVKPFRRPPKIEVEMLNCGGPILPVVHAIGLGADELSVSWGLSNHLAHLVQDVQRKIKPFARNMMPFGQLI